MTDLPPFTGTVTAPFTDLAVTHDAQAERLTLPFGEFVVRVPGDRTAGSLAVVDMLLPAGTIGAAPHIHHGHEEYFLVNDGEVTFDVPGGIEVVAGGGSVAVPRGRAHGFRNVTDHDARLTLLFTPAGYEGYFRGVAEAIASGEPVTPELLVELRAGYNTVAASTQIGPGEEGLLPKAHG